MKTLSRIPHAFAAVAVIFVFGSCVNTARAVDAIWQHNANGQEVSCGEGIHYWPNNRYWTQQKVEGFCSHGNWMVLEPSNWTTDYYPDNNNGGETYQVIIPACNDPEIEGPPHWPLLTSSTNHDLEVTINMMVIQQFGRLQMRAPGAVNRITSLTIVDGDLLNEGVLDMADNPGYVKLNFGYDSTISGHGEITILDTTTYHAEIRVQPGFTVSMVDGHTIRGNGQIIAGDPTLGGGFINNGDILVEKRADGNLTPMTLTGSGFVNNKRIAVVGTSHGSGSLLLQDLEMIQDPAGVITSETSAARFERTILSGGLVTGSDGGQIEFRGGLTTFKNGATLVHTAGMGDTEMYSGGVLVLDSGGVYDFTGDGEVVETAGGTERRGFDILPGGVFRKSGGTGTSVVDTPVNNLGGTIEVQTGTLHLARGGESNNGIFVVAPGATLDLSHPTWAHILQGTFTASGGGRIALNEGQIRAEANTVLEFPGSMFQWAGGMLNNSGQATDVFTNQGAVNIMEGTETPQLRTTLYNEGTVNHGRASGALEILSGGSVQNTGLWDFITDGLIIGAGSGTGPRNFDNQATGVIRKSGGTGTSTISSTVNNFGSIEVLNGILEFNKLTNSGNLHVSAGASLKTNNNITVPMGKTVGGNGIFDIPILTVEGTLKPGDSAGLTEIIGDYIQDNEGLMEIELHGTDPLQYDRLHVSGLATLSGTLDVHLGENFVPWWGDTFDIFTALAVNGTFDTELLPPLTNGLQWFVDYKTTGVRLSVSLIGGFDSDGDVDGNDFLIWQRGESPDPLSASDLANWQANFGTVFSPMAPASTAVPEPTTLLILTLAIGTIFIRRHTIV